MGGTSSKTAATLSSNTVVINQSSLNYLNTTTNSVGVSTLIQNVQKCSAALVQSQNLTVKNISCGNNCDISLFQNQSAWLDFTCAQQVDVQMAVIQQMANTINQALTTYAANDLINQMNSNLSTKSQQDWGTFPWSGSSASTSVTQNINNYVKNNTNVNVTNAIQNSVYASFQNSNISNCIAQIINSQQIQAQNITAGTNFTFTINQAQTASLVEQCIQSANIANQVVSDVTGFAGLGLQITNATTAENTSETKAETEAVNSGILQGISGVVSSIGTAFGNILSGLGLTALVPFMGPISASSSLCCVCLCCLIIILVIFGGMSSLNGTATTTTSPDIDLNTAT